MYKKVGKDKAFLKYLETLSVEKRNSMIRSARPDFEKIPRCPHRHTDIPLFFEVVIRETKNYLICPVCETVGRHPVSDEFVMTRKKKSSDFSEFQREMYQKYIVRMFDPNTAYPTEYEWVQDLLF